MVIKRKGSYFIRRLPLLKLDKRGGLTPSVTFAIDKAFDLGGGMGYYYIVDGEDGVRYTEALIIQSLFFCQN